MRAIPIDLDARLRLTAQCKATNAEPRLDMWISRPTVPLTETEFLESVNIAAGASKASIAVKHTRFGRRSDGIFISYVAGGTARVVSSPTFETMERHTWTDSGFSAPATDVAICFDGRMPPAGRGRYEFITEDAPWVFWINAGAVYGQILGQLGTVTLAEQNATAISAVRAMWSDVPGFDFGLVVFMILAGTIYYRQLIGGVWSDAAPINFGPAGVTWTQIAAQRTWDYRVALQAVDSTGKLYELITQYGGIGSKSAEHIEIKDIKASGKLTEVNYQNAKCDEHIEITSIKAGAPYGGLYHIGVPTIVSARNAADSAGDWGKTASFGFNIHLNAAEVAVNAAAFRIIDSRGVAYTATKAELGADGRTVAMTFSNFNAANGSCKARYEPGTVHSMAGTALALTELSFLPTGLVPPIVKPPKITGAVNI